jgi:hypothetical protein
MNSSVLAGLALLAKTDAFFAGVPELPSMQFIPDHCAEEAEHVSDHSCDHDQRNRSHRIEWFDEVNRLDHVRPENEIEDGLRPAEQNEKRPEQVPSAN